MSMVGKEQYDHELISFVRKSLLVTPAPLSSPYNLNEPQILSQSKHQLEEKVARVLKNKTRGFFIECGALDGETRSNTLWLERSLGWQGLLVEADPLNFQMVQKKGRKAWLAPTCLSTERRPIMVSFDQNFNTGKIDKLAQNFKDTKIEKPVIFCTPITTLMLALNISKVDYFSLDIEGSEFEVLRTIDFEKFEISTLTVEHQHLNQSGKADMKKYMEDRGYQIVEPNYWDMPNRADFVFAKTSLLYKN
ncbi:uncharacterized protein LOC132202164 isoform X2 [Neocloeon triangulifer]|nr:uncharacterized protein LOC132202164 isoform X2 [Neocloeon triangulifer]